MKVKIKKLHPNAVVPSYAKHGDAGLDLTAISKEFICDPKRITEDFFEFDTGLAFEIPEGYVGLVFPRSSISKKGMRLCNAVGVIDSSFRGSVRLRFKGNILNTYEIGDRVGQLIIMPYPEIELEEVEELSDTNRGSLGFGSSGS